MDYWSSSLGFVTGCLSLLSHLVAIVSEFDPNDCPLDCSRPCEIVCPANAISLEGAAGILQVLPSQRIEVPSFQIYLHQSILLYYLHSNFCINTDAGWSNN